MTQMLTDPHHRSDADDDDDQSAVKSRIITGGLSTKFTQLFSYFRF